MLPITTITSILDSLGSLLTRPKRMFLPLGLLAVLAIVSGGHGLSGPPAAMANKMAQHSGQHRAGYSGQHWVGYSGQHWVGYSGQHQAGYSGQHQAGYSGQHRTGYAAHPHVDMQAHWDDFTVASDTPPQVLVPSLNVTLIGKEMVTRKNRTLAAFQGIKYGTAERFKHSSLAGQYWGDVDELTVDHHGEKCSQKSVVGPFATGSEDCLFLDIYVPGMDPPTAPLPVMFFIHGGWFTSGDSSLYLPTRLLDKDVILVVIQYRLSALGWLSLQNSDVPGNAGLSDQITALKWVQLYIDAFGGDPNRVTIFGESAGSASVSLLQTIGPVTEGLFAGAIGQSGSALQSWAIDEEPQQSSETFSDICGCAETSEAEIYDCLMSKDHSEITLCAYDMVMMQRSKGDMNVGGCTPSLQGPEVPEESRLITKMPSEYIEAGEAVDVPLLMGATRDEGSYMFGVIYFDYLVPNALHDDVIYLENNLIGDVMDAFGIEDQTHSLPEVLRAKFLPEVNMSSLDNAGRGMVDMSGVFFVKGGTYETAHMHSTYYTSDTFFYSFDYAGNSSMFGLIFAGQADQLPFEHGVTHSDDLLYLFSFPAPVLHDEDQLTSDRLVTLWTNFATYGHPTPDEVDNYSELGLPKWEILDPKNLHYLLIQEEVTVEKDYTQRWTIQMDLLNPEL